MPWLQMVVRLRGKLQGIGISVGLRLTFRLIKYAHTVLCLVIFQDLLIFCLSIILPIFSGLELLCTLGKPINLARVGLGFNAVQFHWKVVLNCEVPILSLIICFQSFNNILSKNFNQLMKCPANLQSIALKLSQCAS